jgi:hypothetical protein
MKKSFLIAFIRITIGSIFILSAGLKLFPIAPFEILFVKLHIANWFWASIIARSVIAFELVLGGLIIANSNIIKTLRFSIYTLIAFSAFLLYLKIYMNYNDSCGCFGSIIKMKPIESIIKNIVLIFLIVFTLKYQTLNSYFSLKIKRFIALGIIVIGSAFPFIANPLNISETEANYMIKPGKFLTYKKLESINFNSQKNINLLKGKKLVCFLSLKCNACKHSASKLSALQKLNNNSLPIYFIFLEVQDTTTFLKKFFEETDASNIPYTIFSPREFFTVSDNSIPFIMSLDNGEIKNLSNYNDLYPEKVEAFLKGK